MKVPKLVLGGGAIFLAFFIAITVILNLPDEVNYVWALLSLIWGLLILSQK